MNGKKQDVTDANAEDRTQHGFAAGSHGNSLTQWAGWLRENPGFWVILGIILLLGTSGSLKLLYDGSGVGLSNSLNPFVNDSLMILGLSSFLLGAWAIVRRNNWDSGRPFLGLIVILLWCFGMAGVVVDFIGSLNHANFYYIQFFNYNWEEGYGEATVPRKTLRPYVGQHVVFAVRNKQVSGNWDDTTNIDFSDPILVPSVIENSANFEIRVPCPKVSENVRLGDQIEIALVVTSKTDMKQPYSMDSLTGNDDTKILDKFFVYASMKQPTVDNILRVVRLLPSQDRIALTNQFKP